AHPKFRDALLVEAKLIGYLNETYHINNIAPYAVDDERTIQLKNGKNVMIRPAIVYDAGDIKSLFYGLPDNDRDTRFFRHVRSLSREDIQRLCNVDYSDTVAFVAVYGSRDSGKIVGHASYFVNPSTNLAETAFMVAPSWQRTGLGSSMQE